MRHSLDASARAGSRRAPSAVEPTRSQNITVSCRRSVSAGASASRGTTVAEAAGAIAERGNRIEQPAAMASKHHAEIFEILRRELRFPSPVIASMSVGFQPSSCARNTLGWEHVNLTGDYVWSADQRTVKADGYQPLRTVSEAALTAA
jgi:hypothetical protein